jgi:hypothetical protein
MKPNVKMGLMAQLPLLWLKARSMLQRSNHGGVPEIPRRKLQPEFAPHMNAGDCHCLPRINRALEGMAKTL